MSNHKTIKINPELFSLTKQKKTKPDATQAKTKKNTAFKPNNLKNKLLERIKAHKNKEANLGTQTSTSSDIEAQSDEFNDSMAYLSSLAKQSKETTDRDAYVQNTQNAMTKARGKPKTLKNYDASPSTGLHVELELPEGLKESPMVFHTPVPTNDPPIILTPPNAKYVVNDNVPYGCLKGGVKPTFKTWNKTQRQQPSVAQSSPSLIINTSSLGGSSNTTLRETKMKELKDKMRRKQQSLEFAQPAVVPTPVPTPVPMPQPEPEQKISMDQEVPVMIMTDPLPSNQTTFADATTTQNVPTSSPKRIKKTIKRTYTLGKSKIHKKVGVLIKDKNTRKRVLNAQRDIKRHGINDIKQYLRTHGLIKTGSSAPNDIVRKIYESAMLSGEVTNQDKDILLQNFLKEKDE